MMIKLTKKDALKRFLKGENVVLCASKLNPMDVWQPGEIVNIDSYNVQNATYAGYTSETDYFNKLVDFYKHYNCNKAVGLRVNYYTTE